VIAGTATAVSNRVSRRQGRRWAEQQPAPQPQYVEPAYAPAPAPAPAPARPDRLTALKELGELKAQGILTEAEFETEKARILAS
jgi:hypothetical protein